MDLFSSEDNDPGNILPWDGMTRYFGAVLSVADADRFFKTLLAEIDWRHDEYNFAGKHIVTDRQIAWYGDTPNETPRRKVRPWIPELLELKEIAEQTSGHQFQICLLNLYHNGDQGLGWHSDGEMTPVASLSLGTERRFVFKHKATGKKVETLLGHGALLVMEGETQAFWQHRVPPMKRIRTARINLTFRQSA